MVRQLEPAALPDGRAVPGRRGLLDDRRSGAAGVRRGVCPLASPRVGTGVRLTVRSSRFSSTFVDDMRQLRKLTGVILALAGVTVLSATGPDQREWRDYAGGADSSRFVAATEINKSNVSHLQVAWTYPAGQTDFNPLVVRGVIYGRGPNDSFVALDAATGKPLWIHDGVEGFNVRGMNYWESKDAKDRRLIFSTGNLLQEIDAQTGESIASFGVKGVVDLRVGLDRDPSKINQQSRLPGRVFENLLIMGSATNEEYASAPGDIRAFDVRTGKRVWTFHTVPRPGEFGSDTWPKDAWKTVGGANNWGEQSIDEKRGIVYVPTASPKFNFYGRDPTRPNTLPAP